MGEWFQLSIIHIPPFSSPCRQTPAQKLKDFATELRSNRWSYYGDCNNNLVMVLSQSDRQVRYWEQHYTQY